MTGGFLAKAALFFQWMARYGAVNACLHENGRDGVKKNASAGPADVRQNRENVISVFSLFLVKGSSFVTQ